MWLLWVTGDLAEALPSPAYCFVPSMRKSSAAVDHDRLSHGGAVWPWRVTIEGLDGWLFRAGQGRILPALGAFSFCGLRPSLDHTQHCVLLAILGKGWRNKMPVSLLKAKQRGLSPWPL